MEFIEVITKKKELNSGSFIKYILLHIQCNNFIICDYDIKQSDVGKEIQIFNNKNYRGEKINNEIEKVEHYYSNGIKHVL